MIFQQRYQYNPKTDLLGKGGFSKVYKAQDTLLKRTVALKIFSSEASEKYDLVAEISRVINLEHGNLCRYYDVAFVETVTALGDDERIQIGVMEYLDGGNLKTYLQRNPQYMNKLLIDVLHGLSFLHEEGIIHRDLKPQNVLIKNTARGPIAKITDFGISRHADNSGNSSSMLMGTIEYMAPEQFSPQKYGINGKIGTNLDLWSFGLMVYELVKGESIFGSRSDQTSAEQVMGNLLNSDLANGKISDLKEPYLSVVKRCVIKNAGQRVKNAGDLSVFLQNATTSSGVFLNESKLVLPVVDGEPLTQILLPENNFDSNGGPNQSSFETEGKNERKKKRMIIMISAIALLAIGAVLISILKQGTGYVSEDASQSQALTTIDSSNKILPTRNIDKKDPQSTDNKKNTLLEGKTKSENSEKSKEITSAHPAVEILNTDATAKNDLEDYDKVFTKVEIPAQFPGGSDGWRRYLERVLQYPESAQEKGTQGVVRVQFVVLKDGSISEVQALNNPGDGLAEEAKRVIRLGPKWIPAEMNGRNVIYRHIQSITFMLQ